MSSKHEYSFPVDNECVERTVMCHTINLTRHTYYKDLGTPLKIQLRSYGIWDLHFGFIPVETRPIREILNETPTEIRCARIHNNSYRAQIQYDDGTPIISSDSQSFTLLIYDLKYFQGSEIPNDRYRIIDNNDKCRALFAVIEIKIHD